MDYIVKRLNVTPVAGQDLFTVVSPANRRIELIEAAVNGRGATSAAQVLEVGTSTGGTTPGAPIVPTKIEPDSRAADSVVNTTWAAQPTMDTNLLSLGFNGIGGKDRWARPWGVQGPTARNGANLSLHCPTGAPAPQAVDVHLIFREF